MGCTGSVKSKQLTRLVLGCISQILVGGRRGHRLSSVDALYAQLHALLVLVLELGQVLPLGQLVGLQDGEGLLDVLLAEAVGVRSVS